MTAGELREILGATYRNGRVVVPDDSPVTVNVTGGPFPLEGDAIGYLVLRTDDNTDVTMFFGRA